MPASGSTRAPTRHRRRGLLHAQGLDVDELTVAVEIEKPAGPLPALLPADVVRLRDSPCPCRPGRITTLLARRRAGRPEQR